MILFIIILLLWAFCASWLFDLICRKIEERKEEKDGADSP